MITMKTDCSLQWELMAIYVIKGDFPKEVMFKHWHWNCISTDYVNVVCIYVVYEWVYVYVMYMCMCVYERQRETGKEKYEGVNFGM